MAIRAFWRRLRRAWRNLIRAKEPESPKEQQRRSWVEREQAWKDAEEEFARQMADAATLEEKERLSNEFGARRRNHRLEDIAAGKRRPDMHIAMRQIMWARWLEIAVASELEARDAYREILTHHHSDPLLRELRASLVCNTAVASTFEALYADIKYLIPVQKPRDKRHQVIAHSLRQHSESQTRRTKDWQTTSPGSINGGCRRRLNTEHIPTVESWAVLSTVGVDDHPRDVSVSRRKGVSGAGLGGGSSALFSGGLV